MKVEYKSKALKYISISMWFNEHIHVRGVSGTNQKMYTI